VNRGVTRRRTVQVLVVFVAVVLVVNALVGERGFIETTRAREQNRQLMAAIAALEQENLRLLEDIRRLKEDPRAIEEIARRELGLIRQGELLFIVKDVPSPDPNKTK
jgi:cell division protein FtsB